MTTDRKSTAKKAASRRKKPPVNPGDAFRAAVLGVYDLDQGELLLLDQACELVEALAKINAAVRDLDGVEAVGAQGQPVEHPLLRAQREHSTTLARVVESMKLPAPGADVDAEGESRTTVQARKAANVRWLKEKTHGA